MISQVADNGSSVLSSILSALLIPSYAADFAAGIVLFLLSTDRRNPACWLGLGFTRVFSVAEAAGRPRASALTGAPVSPVVTGGAVVVTLLWSSPPAPTGRSRGSSGAG